MFTSERDRQQMRKGKGCPFQDKGLPVKNPTPANSPSYLFHGCLALAFSSSCCQTELAQKSTISHGTYESLTSSQKRQIGVSVYRDM